MGEGGWILGLEKNRFLGLLSGIFDSEKCHFSKLYFLKYFQSMKQLAGNKTISAEIYFLLYFSFQNYYIKSSLTSNLLYILNTIVFINITNTYFHRELLNTNPQCLPVIMNLTIYNELSNSRNPSNMQQLSVIFSQASDAAAKVRRGSII